MDSMSSWKLKPCTRMNTMYFEVSYSCVSEGWRYDTRCLLHPWVFVKIKPFAIAASQKAEDTVHDACYTHACSSKINPFVYYRESKTIITFPDEGCTMPAVLKRCSWLRSCPDLNEKKRKRWALPWGAVHLKMTANILDLLYTYQSQYRKYIFVKRKIAVANKGRGLGMSLLSVKSRPALTDPPP